MVLLPDHLHEIFELPPDDEDFSTRVLQNHIDYIHINPVKRGRVKRVQDWPDSSFHRYVRESKLPINWAGGDVDIDAGE